jgi:hypothetical protein
MSTQPPGKDKVRSLVRPQRMLRRRPPLSEARTGNRNPTARPDRKRQVAPALAGWKFSSGCASLLGKGHPLESERQGQTALIA